MPSLEPRMDHCRGSRSRASLPEVMVKNFNTTGERNLTSTRQGFAAEGSSQHHLSLPPPTRLSKMLKENSPPPKPGSLFELIDSQFQDGSVGPAFSSPLLSGSVRSPPIKAPVPVPKISIFGSPVPNSPKYSISPT